MYMYKYNAYNNYVIFFSLLSRRERVGGRRWESRGREGWRGKGREREGVEERGKGREREGEREAKGGRGREREGEGEEREGSEREIKMAHVYSILPPPLAALCWWGLRGCRPGQSWPCAPAAPGARASHVTPAGSAAGASGESCWEGKGEREGTNLICANLSVKYDMGICTCMWTPYTDAHMICTARRVTADFLLNKQILLAISNTVLYYILRIYRALKCIARGVEYSPIFNSPYSTLWTAHAQ